MIIMYFILRTIHNNMVYIVSFLNNDRNTLMPNIFQLWWNVGAIVADGCPL